MKHRVMLTLCCVLIGISWFLWSFTLTDPNLLYSWHPAWVRFQNMLWHIPRQTMVWWYIGNVLSSFSVYTIAYHSRPARNVFVLLSLVSCLLLVSNNALSHDLYNYMFNAKAVITYGADPHTQSALQIAPNDEWLRFMHNVHTEAPYGRFWTLFSLPPSLMGVGRFLPTFLGFKLYMALGLFVLFFAERGLAQVWGRRTLPLLLFFANPLVLIETLLNGHNDVWMMAMALGSFTLLFKRKYILSFILLLLSTQIKLATILLIPLWILLLMAVSLRQRSTLHTSISAVLERVYAYWADIAAILLFLPLLTDRSQQFHPWYLIWSLSFLPLMRLSLLRSVLVALSLSSMLRYVPFLLVGEYSDTIQLHMRIVTWSALPVAALWWLVAGKIQKKII